MHKPHILDYDPKLQLEPEALPFAGTTRSALTSVPKIDLHRHLVGAIRPEVLVYIANKLGVIIPRFSNDAERIRKASVITNPLPDGYKHFLQKRFWSAFQPIFSSSSGAANAIYWAIADASMDNVSYVEFRVSPYGISPDFQLTLHTFTDSLREGIRAGARDFPHTLVKIIFSVGRKSIVEKWPPAEHSRYYDRLITVAKAYPDVVVGFDLSGDEDRYPNERFIEFADRVKANGFKLTVHAGETDRAAAVWDAVELLSADRIGHGVGARKDPELLNLLADKGIPLELCPTSNWLLGIIPDLLDHPCKDFIENKIIVTVNTDDPTLFRSTTLSAEFYRLIVAGQINLSDVERISRDSISASFASEKEKAALLSKVNNYFFVEKRATAESRI
jgi:adenosine deaminase